MEERSFADAQDDNAGEENGRAADAEEDGGRQIAAPTEENEAARAAENVTLTAEDRAAEVRRVAVEEASFPPRPGTRWRTSSPRRRRRALTPPPLPP